jgi:hypothetical protein
MEIPINHQPTKDDMRKLRQREYYAWDGVVHLNTYREGCQALFVCPFCYTKYRRDGMPHGRAKPTIHRHGIDGGLMGTIASKCTHCSRLPPHLIGGYYYLFVDDK